MRFETDGDTVGVETDPEDTELARAVADTARSAVDLVTALSGDGDDDAPAGGECYECGEAGDLRPFAAANEAGEPISIDVCADCQGDLVAAQIEANADAEPAAAYDSTPDQFECPSCGEYGLGWSVSATKLAEWVCDNCGESGTTKDLDAFEGDA